MEKERLTAFSDGVIAVIITIMVLDLKAPHDASLGALGALAPGFLSYVLSFVYVAIYWNNRHHFFHLVHRVQGATLWANLHLLFWLSLIPFTTAWMGENHFSSAPTAVYGVVLLKRLRPQAWHYCRGSAVGKLGYDLLGSLLPELLISRLRVEMSEAQSRKDGPSRDPWRRGDGVAFHPVAISVAVHAQRAPDVTNALDNIFVVDKSTGLDGLRSYPA